MAPRQRSLSRLSSSEDDTIGPASSLESRTLVSGDASKLKDDVGVGSTARPHDSHERRRREVVRGRIDQEGGERSKCSDGNVSVKERDRHDIFNLVALVPVLALTAANYDWEKVLGGMGPELSWTDEYFAAYWLVTALYFLVDIIWVKVVPNCVKSPDLIVKHHIVAVIYLIAPIYLLEFRWCMGACLTVELNTFFLIARRVAYLRRDAIPTAAIEFFTAMFYATWVAIRCVFYPYIMVVYVQKAHAALIETGTLMHWPIIFVPVHFSLCLLNLKWTYDIFSPIVRKWFQSGDANAGGV